MAASAGGAADDFAALTLLPEGVGSWVSAPVPGPWRMRERTKTVAGTLVCCLNVGVDPPDIVRPAPCATLECWVDPSAIPAQKVLDVIAQALQSQYESWQPRARFRTCLDPTADDLKRLCDFGVASGGTIVVDEMKAEA